MRFSDIPGLKEVKGNLVRAVAEGRVAHAYLFHGEEGSAALPLALAFAQYLLCTSREEEDACGRCAACQKAEKLIHPDIHFSFPVVKTGSTDTKSMHSGLFLGQWREIMLKNPYIGPMQWYEHLGVENKQGMIYTRESEEIITRMSLTPYEADRKVLILWLPEKMHRSAANPLLKLIEEPPAGTVFLLVSMDPAQVLPTILSRCQTVHVPGVDPAGMQHFLAGRYGLQGEALGRIVARAGGNIGEALTLAGEEGDEERFLGLFIRWMRNAYGMKITELTKWLDEIADLGREKQKVFLSYAMHMLRENLMMRIFRSDQENLRLTKEEYEFSKKFSGFIRPENMEDIYMLLSEAWDHIAGNVYGKLVFMDVSLKLNKLLKK